VFADFATHEQARTALFEYIEVFYNRQRRHSTLGYVRCADATTHCDSGAHLLASSEIEPAVQFLNGLNQQLNSAPRPS